MSNGRYTPTSAAQTAKAKGYKWLAMEWNQWGNSQRGTAMKQACDATGLIFTIWFTRSGQPGNDMDFTAAEARKAVVESGAAGFLGEGEIPPELTGGVQNPQEQNWPDLIHELEDLDIAKGVVTNFAPFIHNDGRPFPEKAKPLIDAGWACVTENFISETPNATPDRTDFYARTNLGWSETQPMVELKRLADYGDLSAFRNISMWSAGDM